MKLDRLDFETLDALHHGGPEKGFTTTEIAKEVFDDSNGVKLSNLDGRIRARLNKLAKYGIVVKDETTSPNKYNIAYQDVVYGSTDMTVEDDLGSETTPYQLESDKMLFISNEEGIEIRGFVPLNQDNDLDKYIHQQEAPDELNDPEWLKQKYVDEDKTVEEISNVLDVKQYYVKIWLYHFGLKSPE